MADAPKRGRAKPVAERFEVFETDPTAHLTEAQKTWKAAKLRPAAEPFAVLTPPATLVLKLHLAGSLANADRLALAGEIDGLVQAMSDLEREWGGGGLTLVNRREKPAMVILTLRHAVAEGAAARATQLAKKLNDVVTDATSEPARELKLHGDAAGSPERRVKSVIAGSRTVSRFEVVTTAA